MSRIYRFFRHIGICKSNLRTAAILCLAAGLLGQSSALLAQDKADVIVLPNGDQLTGTIENAVGDSITFKNPATGEITIPLKKIKEIHSQNSFVVIRKGEKIAKISRPAGTLTYSNGVITVATPGTPETVPISDLAFIVEKSTYEKEVIDHQGFLHGWSGAISGGATLIRATQTGTSLSAGIALLREIPSVAYLPPKTRTTFNLLETYGKLTQPVIPQTTPPTPPSEAKTSIFHTDAEHDIYFTPRLYALGDVSYDHNFSQGLNLQQIYGGGLGWTPILTPVQQLDFKADVHYQMQTFIQPNPIDATHPRVPNQNLIGNTFGEAYHRTLPAKILFTESASILPSWNNLDAYSAVAAAGLSIPAYKRFSVGLNATDNYLNLPSPGFKKNSFQFITSIVYNLK